MSRPILSFFGLGVCLGACAAHTSPPQLDRKFYAVQAVTAFPAKISDDGSLVRVCGAPLVATEPAADAANGVEVTANFVASSGGLACAPDADFSFKDGELADGTPVTAGRSVAVGNFQFVQRCVSPEADASENSCVALTTTPVPSTVAYKNLAPRCDPANLDASRINLAIVLDNSGSMMGNVDAQTLKEDADGDYDPAPQPLTNVASDWHGARFNAAEAFVASLNPNDRVIGYLFDETGVKVASSDSFLCNGSGSSADNGPCRPEDPRTCPKPGSCDSDPTLTNDSYLNAGLDGAQCLAFGSEPRQRVDLNNGLELRRDAANGRGSLWQAVDTAFTFLTQGGTACPLSGLKALHILVIDDGPDTCVDSDDFSYMSLRDADTGNMCRVKCANSDVTWRDLQLKMAQAGYPVHVHFIQFQAPGYLDPDPRQLELACRTDGTYQFIHQQDFGGTSGDALAKELTRAMTRVRNGLSGTWRVGFKAAPLVVKGGLMAVDGDFVFADATFASLDPAVHALSPDDWRFTFSGTQDRRALLRTACLADTDCGGTNSCSANHCGEDGVCRPDPAPNGEPCAGGTCKDGACIAGQTCAAAINSP